LDITLARRILRDFTGNDKNKKVILEELNLYLNHSRKLFAAEEVKASADIVIDGNLSCDQQIDLILESLRKNHSTLAINN